MRCLCHQRMSVLTTPPLLRERRKLCHSISDQYIYHISEMERIQIVHHICPSYGMTL